MSVIDSLGKGLRAIVGAFSPLWECLKQLWDTVVSLWSNCIKPITDSIADIVIQAVLVSGDSLGNLMSGPIADLIRIIVDVASVVLDSVSVVLRALEPAFALVTNTLVPALSAGFQWAFGLIGTIITELVATFGYFTSGIKNFCDKVHDYVHNLVGAIKDFFAGIPQAIRNTMNNVISWVETGINNIIYKFNNSGVMNLVNQLTGGAFYVNPIYIPRLAKGGVVTTPTIAQIGEYSGASSNPEIVAPQSILKETIDASNGELASVFAQIGMQIVQAIERKELDVQIGDTAIAKSAARGNRSYQLATGQSLF